MAEFVEPDFTIGDIFREFEEEFGPAKERVIDDCYTTQELMEIWNIKYYTVMKKLKEFKREGRLIETSKHIIPLGRPGVRYPVPAYQVKEKTNEDQSSIYRG